MERLSFQSYHQGLIEALNESDAEVYELIKAEYERLQDTDTAFGGGEPVLSCGTGGAWLGVAEQDERGLCRRSAARR